MSVIFDELKEEIRKGLKGENGAIPFPLERLDYFLNITKNLNIVVGGSSGSGKSSFTTEVFVIKPLLWYLKNRGRKDLNLKLSIVYFGMERKQYRSTARWLSRLIFADRGVLISVNKILGIGSTLDQKELELIGEYKHIFEEIEPLLTCYEGVIKPDKIEEYLREFALKHGVIEKVTEANGVIEKEVYRPNHPNHIILTITDHVGLIATSNKKAEIDKFSQIMRIARDTYGFSNIQVQQLNRSISETGRAKMGDIQPQLSDFQDTSSTIQDADVVLALLDPYRHVKEGSDGLGYEIDWLKDDKGVKYYRSIHILKNSFNSDGISVGLAFYPFCSMFKTLPKPHEFDMETAHRVKNGNYFLELGQLPQQQKESPKL